MRHLALLAVLGCGHSDTLSGTPSEQGLWGLGECSGRCERMKGQLENDFGVMSPSCWDEAMFSAGSLEACDALFQQRWGVTFFH